MVKKHSSLKKSLHKESLEKEQNIEKTKLNFDIKLLKKSIPFLITIFLLGFVMWFAFFIRSGPINLDGLEDNVRSSVHSQIQNIISQEIDRQYPNLNAAYKQELVQKEYKKVLDTGVFEIQGQKYVVEDIVKQQSVILKDAFKADNGHTYLTEMDSHHFFHFATNYYKYGHTGDTILNGEPWLTTKVAPEGYAGTYNPEFLVWLESKMFSFNNLDKTNSTDAERTAAIYLLPVFLVMLSAIPIYFIIKKFSNDLFAFFGSLILVSIGTYVSRTVAGFVDTDAFNVLFPGLIVLFLLYAFVYKNIWLKALFIILSGFFMGMYLWVWGAGWFIFIFILISLVIYLIYIIISHFIFRDGDKNFFNKIKNDIIILISYVFMSFIFVYLFVKANIFTLTYNGLKGSTSEIVGISTQVIWPNVLSSVAELNPASFPQIISSVGGNIIFIIAMLGILFLALDYTAKNERFNLFNKLLIFFSIIWFISIANSGLFVNLTINQPKLFIILLFIPIGIALVSSLFNRVEDSKIFLAILLSIWAAGTIYMSFNGVRFILLLAPAFCVAFGLGMYYISKIINNFTNKEFDVKHKVKQVIPGFIFATILFLILFTPMAEQANAISKGTTPTFDDVWYNSMYKIKNESNENAIITSWWDFGHFYSAISHRGTIFDGGTQGLPQAHWVGRLFMEDEEDVSHDILQMLVCGGNNAHKTMLDFSGGTTADAVKINKIINMTFGKSQEEKKEILKTNKYYKYDEKQIDEIMNYLACSNPPENYVITSEDMIGKAGVWAHWGSWDFTKKYVYDNYQIKTVEQIALDIDENVTIIQKYVNELNNLDKTSIEQDIKRDNLINQWLASYPSYVPIQGRYEYPCESKNTTLVCQNGISVDMINGKVSSGFNAQVTFANLVYPTNEGKVNIVKQSENGEIDVILIPGQSGFNVVLAQYPLGNSLFTKLFYLDGYGTTKFDKFDSQSSVGGISYTIWKVNWSDVEDKKFTNSSNIKK